MEEKAVSPMPALYAALAKAQGQFTPIAKNREVKIQMKGGGSYQFRYADLEAILSATRPALSANGLAVFQRIEPVAGTTNNNLITTIAHQDGGLLDSVMLLPAGYGGDLKSLGANLSYLRRYAYSSLLCVSADDDLDEDGQPAGDEQQDKKPEAKKSAGLAPYSDEEFANNYPAWQEAVSSGKATPERIIAMVSTKGVMSDEQKQAVMAIAQEGEQQ